jgi:magnesium chelatase family protein
MLARRLTTILPAMTLAEALETTRIHCVAGLTGDRTALVTTRPCRAGHHPIAAVGVIGGGAVPLPGEVSLDHNGRDANAGGIAGVHTAYPQRPVPTA